MARDLNLDQIVGAVTAGHEHLELEPVFETPLHDHEEIAFRQAVMRDLETDAVMHTMRDFVAGIRDMRSILDRSGKMYYRRQKERVFVDAASRYATIVAQLTRGLAEINPTSRALRALAAYMAGYDDGAAMGRLRSDIVAVRKGLDSVRYCVAIRGNVVTVRDYANEPDYGAVVAETFDRFRQNAAKDYRVRFREEADVSHVEGQILDRVAWLNPVAFDRLERFADEHRAFVDPVIDRFYREIHFYIRYLDYIAPIRAAGLQFCYPQISADEPRLDARDTFDLAMAAKLVVESTKIVTNNMELTDDERICVVSGPNQGGKTTFLRTFGQLYHLASIGCPVPGRSVRLRMSDRIYTHFDREEEAANLRGKLQDDLIRIRDILDQITPDSIVLMNELFSSTTLDDAVFLATKVMHRLIETGCTAVFVTFIDELARLDPAVISMVSTVLPEDQSQRTFKVVRRPADGRAYAISIAEKYRLTADWLEKRLSR